MMDPDTREWISRRPAPTPAPAPTEVPADHDLRSALQQICDSHYRILTLFWRGIFPGEDVREGRIRAVDLYEAFDQLSEIRRRFNLEDQVR